MKLSKTLPTCVLALTVAWSVFSATAHAATNTVMALSSPASQAIRAIEMRKINIKTLDNTVFSANIGYLEVPEDRAAPDGNIIKIAFIQIKSSTAGDVPPVFHFHGGPDDLAYLSKKVPLELMNNLSGTEDATADFSNASRNYRNYLDFTDVVVMDVRGLGHSRPRLTCSENPSSTDFLLEPEARVTNINKALSACFKEYEDKGVNLSAYNLSAVAEDFNDLRTALGYQKVTLQGSSFGSQTAFTIMQRYPQHVARAYLAGLEPLSDTFDMPSEVQQATQAFIALANNDLAVRNQLPNGDMGYTLRTIMKRLKLAPQTLEIEDPNGAKFELHLDHHAASQMLLSQGILRYRGDTRKGSGGASNIIPLILALYYEAYDGIAGVLQQELFKSSATTIFNASALALDCASGVSEARKKQFETESKLPTTDIILSPFGLEGIVGGKPHSYCANNFKVQDMGDAWRTEKPLDIPVLFYHGDFDGTTPLANAQRALSRFPNGKLIIVEGAAHFVKELELLSPELKAIRTEFVRTGILLETVPSKVTLPPIKFQTVSTPVVWAFKMGLGNTLMKLAQ
ncbi:MAG: alpha/beta fold hydrolase [Kordiimonadaceae bacterium]|nr:alpha/beta fold hydrolase [Kordiimonadaceae bacterium]